MIVNEREKTIYQQGFMAGSNAAQAAIKAAERRAEVAERALYNACCEQNKHWCVQCDSFAECDTSNEMCIEAKKHAEELIKQAEKELAEEKKDE